MKTKNNILYIILSILLFNVSCSSSSDDDNSGGGTEMFNPEQATLKLPNNNEECTDGVVISNIEAKLTFQWNKAENADSYSLYVKNLDTDTEKSYDTTSTQLEVTIDRAVPYSWYVVSKSDQTTATATSNSWKFYLSGEGIENYAPFPADLKSPTHKSNIKGSTVTLEWIGSDVDDDIEEYDIFMDSSSTPTTKLATVSDQELTNQSVTPNTTYYWKVVAHDSKGNSSTSQVFSFKVQ